MEYDFNDGKGPVEVRKHANGGGWVSLDSCVYFDAFIGEDSFVGGKSYIEANVMVGGQCLVYGSDLKGSEILLGATVVNSTLTNSKVGPGAKLNKCVLKNSPVDGEASDSVLVESYGKPNSKIVSSNLEKVSVDPGSEVLHSKLINGIIVGNSKIENSHAKGNLHVEGGSLIQGATLDGTMKIGGASVIKDAIIFGTWDISESQVSGKLNGAGSLTRTRIESGARLHGSLALFEVEVKGEAVLRGNGHYCSVTGSYVYDQAILILAGGLYDSEIFGDADVTLTGTHDGLYLYGGTHSLGSKD